MNFSNDQKGDGNTILHSAVLMDYERGCQLIRLGEVKVEQDGTGGQEIEMRVEMKVIKKAIGNEGKESSKTKIQIIKLLVQKGFADPNVKNNHGHTAL